MKAGYVFCDGGARGNPGPAAAAAVVYDLERARLGAQAKVLGTATNNTAEYQGVLIGLALARQLRLEQVSLRLDSELVVRQLEGKYRVKHPQLKLLWEEAMEQLRQFAAWDVKHVPRAENAEADRLVNQALDGQKI